MGLGKPGLERQGPAKVFLGVGKVSPFGAGDGEDLVGLGVAWRPAPSWVVAVDLKRYFWDHAIDTIEVVARHPNVEGAPSEIVMPFVFNWEDQWVAAVGVDYRLTPQLTLRAGYNYGEDPVPDATLTPLFPATTERHASLGFAWLAGNRTYEFAVERAFAKDQTNSNPDPRVNPFGPGGWVDQEYLPEKISEKIFYKPTDRGFERAVKQKMAELERKRKAKKPAS